MYPQSFTLQQEYNKKTYTAGGSSGRDKDGVAGDEAPESAGRVAIHVTNTTASGAVPIAYRMLTTDRQRFTVSPREGIVPPGATHTILISLNAPRAVSSGGGDEGEGVAPNKKGGAASAERFPLRAESLAALTEELRGTAKRIVTVGGNDASSAGSCAKATDADKNAAGAGAGVGGHQDRFISQSSFKLEYRGLCVASGSSGAGSPSTSAAAPIDDTDAVAAIAAGRPGAPTISDLIKAGGRALKRSVVLECTAVHIVHYHGGPTPQPSPDVKVKAKAACDGRSSSVTVAPSPLLLAADANINIGDGIAEATADASGACIGTADGNSPALLSCDFVSPLESSSVAAAQNGIESNKTVAAPDGQCRGDVGDLSPEPSRSNARDAENNIGIPSASPPSPSPQSKGVAFTSAAPSESPMRSSAIQRTAAAAAAVVATVLPKSDEQRTNEDAAASRSNHSRADDEGSGEGGGRGGRATERRRIVSAEVALTLLCGIGAIATAAVAVRRVRKGGASLLWL